jgi:hypothetical protein
VNEFRVISVPQRWFQTAAFPEWRGGVKTTPHGFSVQALRPHFRLVRCARQRSATLTRKTTRWIQFVKIFPRFARRKG